MRSRPSYDAPGVLQGRVVLRFEHVAETGEVLERFAFNVPARWQSRAALAAAFHASRRG